MKKKLFKTFGKSLTLFEKIKIKALMVYEKKLFYLGLKLLLSKL